MNARGRCCVARAGNACVVFLVDDDAGARTIRGVSVVGICQGDFVAGEAFFACSAVQGEGITRCFDDAPGPYAV